MATDAIRQGPAAADAPAPPPRLPSLGPSTLKYGLIGAAIITLHVIAVIETEFSLSALADGYEGMVKFIGEATPPDLSWEEVVRPGLEAALVTLYIAILGTTFSVPFAFLFAILGARTTTTGPVVYQTSRSIMSFLRAVPDVVFALIFVTAVGLGPFPGVLALIFHNVGVMGKLWSESIEELDSGPVDALRVGGAGRLQVVQHAVIPAVTPTWVGLFLYRFDVNVRASLVLGLVGAGGIGFLINQSIQLFRFPELLTHIIIVLILVVIVDNFSAVIRKRLGVDR